jgi:hypothetical protein
MVCAVSKMPTPEYMHMLSKTSRGDNDDAARAFFEYIGSESFDRLREEHTRLPHEERAKPDTYAGFALGSDHSLSDYALLKTSHFDQSYQTQHFLVDRHHTY